MALNKLVSIYLDQFINLLVQIQACSVKINLNKVYSNVRIFGFKLEEIKWTNVIFLTWLHVFACYGLFHAILNPVKIGTVLFLAVVSIYSGLGMSVGGHRLWAHKSFKARLPLRILLLILQTSTLNGSALSYARDHRVHHKWTDKEPDPKNPSLGFFYSHMGWWLLKKKQIVKDHGQKLNFDDLYGDPLLRFQHRFYIPLAILFGFIIPSTIPWLLWQESLWTSFVLCGPSRVCVILHHLFTVNSLAHYVGSRPYNRFMLPTENDLVIYLSLGEGNHNYHHTFPSDYNSSEFKSWQNYNPSTLFIQTFRLLGLAYDLRRPPKRVVQQVIKNKGIPEYFEPIRNRSLFNQIISGIFHWIFGNLVTLWPIVTVILIKAVLGKDLIVIHQSWQQNIDWIKQLSNANNFVVYYD